MPKLKPVTMTEIDEALDSGDKAAGDAMFVASRISAGYAPEIEGLIEKAGQVLANSRALADLAQQFLMKARLQEMKRETEALVRRQAEKKRGAP